MEVKNGVQLIDMQEQDRAGLAEKIVRASEEWGCFRILNHGISPELLSEMKEVCRNLFDLPLEIKQGSAPPGPDQRYTPPHMASPYFEGLKINDVAFPGVVDDFCSQMKTSQHHRETILKYADAIYGVAKEVGGRMMEGYGLLRGGVGQPEVFKDWICQLQLNRYNYSKDSVGSAGALSHSDLSFLTILQDDQLVNGLEIVNQITGEWVSVDPVPDTLVVVVGDLGKVWSNGRFCNVKHRVQCYKPVIRVSITIFVVASRDKRVITAEELVDSKHPRLYREFDFEEKYRKLRSSTNHLLAVLSNFSCTAPTQSRV